MCGYHSGGHAWFEYFKGACVCSYSVGDAWLLFGEHAWFSLGGHVSHKIKGHTWFYSGGCVLVVIRWGMRGFIRRACMK